MTRGDESGSSAGWHLFFGETASEEGLQAHSPHQRPIKAVSPAERGARIAAYGAPMHMVTRSSDGGGADDSNGGMPRSTSTAELCALGVLETDGRVEEPVFGSDDATTVESADLGSDAAAGGGAGGYDTARGGLQRRVGGNFMQHALRMDGSSASGAASGGSSGSMSMGHHGGDNMPRSRSVSSFHAYEVGALAGDHGNSDRMGPPAPVGRPLRAPQPQSSAPWPQPTRSQSHATALAELDASSVGLSRSLPQSSAALQYYQQQDQQQQQGQQVAGGGSGSGTLGQEQSRDGGGGHYGEDIGAPLIDTDVDLDEGGGGPGSSRDVVYGFLRQPPHVRRATAGRSLVYNHSDTDLVASFDRFGLNGGGSGGGGGLGGGMGGFGRRSPLSGGDRMNMGGGSTNPLPSPTASPMLSSQHAVGVPLEEMGLGSPNLRGHGGARQQPPHFLGSGGSGGGGPSGSGGGGGSGGSLGMSRHASYPLLSSAAGAGGAGASGGGSGSGLRQREDAYAASPQLMGLGGGGGGTGGGSSSSLVPRNSSGLLLQGSSSSSTSSRPPLHHGSSTSNSIHQQSPPRRLGVEGILLEDGRYVSTAAVGAAAAQQQQQQGAQQGQLGQGHQQQQKQQQQQQQQSSPPQTQASPRHDGLQVQQDGSGGGGGSTGGGGGVGGSDASSPSASAAAMLPPGWPQMAALTPQEQVALYNAVVVNQNMAGGGGGGSGMRLPSGGPNVGPISMIDLANMLAAAHSPSNREHAEMTAAMLRAHGLQSGTGMTDQFGRLIPGMGPRGRPGMGGYDSEDPGDGNVYQVQFKRATRNFLLAKYAMAAPRLPAPGDYVKVEADRGEDMGLVLGRFPLPDGGKPRPATAGHKHRGFAQYEKERIVRLASEEELHMLHEKQLDEARVLDVCRSKVRQRALRMAVIDAEFQFDRHKLTFFFEADGRVDFRELVRDLFAIYKTRIWMQQIEPDGTAHSGGGGGPGGYHHMHGAPSAPYDDGAYGVPPPPFHVPPPHHMGGPGGPSHHGGRGAGAYGGNGGVQHHGYGGRHDDWSPGGGYQNPNSYGGGGGGGGPYGSGGGGGGMRFDSRYLGGGGHGAYGGPAGYTDGYSAGTYGGYGGYPGGGGGGGGGVPYVGGPLPGADMGGPSRGLSGGGGPMYDSSSGTGFGSPQGMPMPEGGGGHAMQHRSGADI